MALTNPQNIGDLFEELRLDLGIIVLCVRWRPRRKLSFPDLLEMMDDPGLELEHATIMPRIFRAVGCAVANSRVDCCVRFAAQRAPNTRLAPRAPLQR
jgi:hypothetical protein